MKALKAIIFYICVCTLAVGCASTKITEQESKFGTEKLPYPDTIYVFPIATTPADLPSWSAAAKQAIPPAEQQTPESIEVGRKLGQAVQKELVTQIQEMGLVALEGDQQTVPRLHDILFVGYFVSVDEGSTVKRMALGFGAGAAELQTAVEGYQVTKEGMRLLGSGKLDSGGGKMPGVALPIVVLAATANPIGLIVGGGAKVYGEMSGKDKIEGAGKRTAEAIAEHLRGKFKEQGWVR
jgi:Domain of unknown function (DUF4410)